MVLVASANIVQYKDCCLLLYDAMECSKIVPMASKDPVASDMTLLPIPGDSVIFNHRYKNFSLRGFFRAFSSVALKLTHMIGPLPMSVI
jgi:hypothetical protein